MYNTCFQCRLMANWRWARISQTTAECGRPSMRTAFTWRKWAGSGPSCPAWSTIPMNSSFSSRLGICGVRPTRRQHRDTRSAIPIARDRCVCGECSQTRRSLPGPSNAPEERPWIPTSPSAAFGSGCARRISNCNRNSQVIFLPVCT